MSLLTEFKRRGVARVIASYAVVAWLLIQIIVSVEEPLGLPTWSDTFVIVALIAGFPICAVIAWLYDFTDRGIERTVTSGATQEHVALTRADVMTLYGTLAATVFVLGTAGWMLLANSPRSLETIAILPFELVMTDEETDYLGESIRDSLIRRLSRLENLRIKTMSSNEAEAVEAHRLGELLGVDAIAQGSIRQIGNTFEISAELIADDGSILWRDAYSSEVASLLEIESRICVELASRLGRELSATEELALRREPTSNTAAYNLYNRARFYWNRRSTAAFLESIDLYNRATGLDPNFALAHAGLASTYLMLLGWGVQPPTEVAGMIVQSANLAIQRDSTLAEPHAVLGYYNTIYEMDWDRARAEFLTAIELDNNYSSTHHWYAFLLLTEGNYSAAVDSILLARDLEPMSYIINAEVGAFLMYDGQYQRALEELESALTLDPNYVSTVAYLMRAHTLLGNTAAALEQVARWRQVRGDNLLMSIYGAIPLPMLGLEDEAREVYSEALTIAQEVYVQPGLLGLLAAALGDLDAAFEHFDAALAEGSLILSWLREPLLEDLQADPRFETLLVAMGLEP